MTQQIATRELPEELESIRELEDRFAIAVRQRELLENYIKERLTPGKHFYRVQGSKNSLTKEGAELICLPHGYKPSYSFDAGPSQPPEDNSPYQLTVKCRLMKGQSFAGEGIGSASSHVTKTDGERVPRQPDIGLRHNATLKMAQKSAYIAATLNATAASEFFTQDLEPEDGAEVAESKPAPKDNRFYCVEHRTNWTKKTGRDGKSWYSHKQGDGWCNMADARLDAKDNRDQPQEPSPEAQPAHGEPVEPAAAQSSPTSVVELLNRGMKELGYRDRAEMFAVLGIQSATELASSEKLAGAWNKLIVAKKGWIKEASLVWSQ